MTENHFRSYFSPFQINTQLLFFFTKWLPTAILDDKYHRVLVIWDLNGYGEYEFDRCICDKVGLYKRWHAAAETVEQPKT